MYYVSSFDRKSGRYGITDTADGVTEFYTKDEILSFPKSIQIAGVRGKTIQIVNGATGVVQKDFDAFESLVRKEVEGWTEELCMEVARSAHFVKKIKGLPKSEMNRVVVENIYPQSIRDAVSQAADFSNELVSVDCTNRDTVINALRNNVCVVLQQKTNGALTSFMCTGGLAVSDSIYDTMFFDSVYLCKQLYGYTYNAEKVRPKRASTKEKNPDMLNVFSCALRFRREGKNHDGACKELSSPFYTVNLAKVLGMYVLVNPQGIGDRIIPEFQMTNQKDMYNFDFDMWRDVKKCLASRVNMFKDNKDWFLNYIDTQSLTKGVELTDLMQRFDDDFNYMMYLRSKGYSF